MCKLNIYGDAIELSCQNHENVRIQAKEPKEFSLLKEGGCKQKCNFRFNLCGHSCEKLCHTLDYCLLCNKRELKSLLSNPV